VNVGSPEVGAAAIICFEWLQRPENVLAGKVSWTGYLSEKAPTSIRIEHHKTKAEVLHPLEEVTPDGKVLFYAEAEEILAKVPRLGVPVVIRQYQDGHTGAVERDADQQGGTEAQGGAKAALQLHPGRLPPRGYD
jgi:predicted TIM-barrel fold metal-dependent hydrolase